MKVVKAILVILLLVTVLAIPKIIEFLLNFIISVLVIIQKTNSYFIGLIKEEIVQKNGKPSHT